MPGRTRRKLCAALLPLLAALLILPASALAAAPPPPFDAPERSARGDPLFQRHFAPLWQRVLEAEKKRPAFNAAGDGLRPPDAEQWRNLAQRAKTSPELDVLRMVSGYFNQWLPSSDQNAWSMNEHWDSPQEFIQRRGGDCEDYAITKYYALRFLGVPARSLRVTVIRQKGASGRFDPGLHAVLAARANDTWFILDNNARPRDGIFPQAQYQGRFLPLYSFNEEGAWAHFPDPLKAR